MRWHFPVPRAVWRLQVLTVAGMATAACARVRTGALSGAPVDAPSPLFTAMLQTIADSSRVILALSGLATVPLQIDPRPLRTTPLGGVETSEKALLMAAGPAIDTSVPTRELAGRVAALRRAGVPVGDIGLLNECPGALGLATAEERKACPDHRMLIAAFGVLDSTALRAVVQVLVLRADNRGKSATITPFEMEHRQGRWVLGKLGQIIIVE